MPKQHERWVVPLMLAAILLFLFGIGLVLSATRLRAQLPFKLATRGSDTKAERGVKSRRPDSERTGSNPVSLGTISTASTARWRRRALAETRS